MTYACSSRPVLRTLVPTNVIGRLSAALLIAIVALTPRASGAQAAGSPLQMGRHTLAADVRVITHTAIASHSRPGVELMRARLGDVATVQLAQRAWIASVDVRSNVSAQLVTDGGPPGSGWQLVDTNGRLVPWSDQRVPLSAVQAAGQHVIDVIWIAPDVATPPPAGSLLRLEPTASH